MAVAAIFHTVIDNISVDIRAKDLLLVLDTQVFIVKESNYTITFHAGCVSYDVLQHFGVWEET